MKKKLVTLFLALMATCCLFGFAACDGIGSTVPRPPISGEENGDEPNGDNPTDNPSDDPNGDNPTDDPNDNTPVHTHAFTVWEFDGKTHYKACSCGQIQAGTAEAHNFDENGDCTVCEATQGTKGLEYTLSADKSYYICSGIGTATETDMVIANVYEGLPVTTIGMSAFYMCSSLTSVTIGNGITTIKGGLLVDSAFEGCSNLTSVTIPDSVTTIGESAFYNCSSLTSVYITDIEKWCAIDFGGSFGNPLYYARNLYVNNELVTELVIPDGVTTLGKYAFYNCNKLTSVTLPDGVTTLGKYAFRGCSSLTSVTIPDSVTTIGGSAFRDCSALTNVTIPDGITIIESGAFLDCSGLMSITLPDDVTTIGESAFGRCSSLTSVTIPDSVTTIGEGAFTGCTSLTSITVDNNNQNYQSIDGNLYTKDGKTLIQYAIGKTVTKFTIPDSVTKIGNGAFHSCSKLTSVTIGNGVTTIKGRAFWGCSSLTSVTIPDSVTTIGWYAFYMCSSLTSVYYHGTASEWAEIEIGSSNSSLTSATRYYYSETDPTASGNYWRYVDGVPAPWETAA